MEPQSSPLTLKTQARECRCATCPPDRVCAWSCIQGTSVPDIVIGALLEQSGGWALHLHSEPGLEVAQQAVWDSFNG